MFFGLANGDIVFSLQAPHKLDQVFPAETREIAFRCRSSNSLAAQDPFRAMPWLHLGLQQFLGASLLRGTDVPTCLESLSCSTDLRQFKRPNAITFWSVCTNQEARKTREPASSVGWWVLQVVLTWSVCIPLSFSKAPRHHIRGFGDTFQRSFLFPRETFQVRKSFSGIFTTSAKSIFFKNLLCNLNRQDSPGYTEVAFAGKSPTTMA